MANNKTPKQIAKEFLLDALYDAIDNLKSSNAWPPVRQARIITFAAKEVVRISNRFKLKTDQEIVNLAEGSLLKKKSSKKGKADKKKGSAKAVKVEPKHFKKQPKPVEDDEPIEPNI